MHGGMVHIYITYIEVSAFFNKVLKYLSRCSRRDRANKPCVEQNTPTQIYPQQTDHPNGGARRPDEPAKTVVLYVFMSCIVNQTKHHC